MRPGFLTNMSESPNRLVVYGTLRPTFSNPFANYLYQHSHRIGETTFPGLLFDLMLPDTADYPGAIYQLGAITTVTGTAYDISRHKSSTLAYLDNYEGVGAAFDQPNEYVRAVIPVRYCNDVIVCWVYLYSLSTDGLPVIASGDYGRYSRNE